MTYTGDILIQTTDTGDVDATFENGQPLMTDGFETCVQLAIYGVPNWQNGTTKVESERFVSTFQDVIRRATVSNKTREDGRIALEKALAFLVDEKAASSVVVTGQILSVYAIGWMIEITAPSGATKYAISWEKGSLTAGYKRMV